MAIKLINVRGKIHDYRSAKACLTHATIEASDTYPVKFENLDTHAWKGVIKTCEFVNRGDFIFKDMHSGSVGVYEITQVYGFKEDPYLKEPFRHYSCEFTLCGYLGADGSTIEVFKGYGVNPVASTRSWLSRLFGGQRG